MDTMFSVPKYEEFRLIGIITGVTILAMLCSFPGVSIYASDTAYIAKKSAPAINIDAQGLKEKIFQEVSPELKQKEFNENIRKKYPNAVIYDVANGVKHIKLTKYYSGRPVRVNVVEINSSLAGNMILKPALSSSENLKSRRTISTIAKNNNAIVALNGTYFKPQTGVPLGTLMIDEKLYTGPIYDRVALGIFDDGYDVARVQLNASIKSRNAEVKIDNINQPRTLSTHVIAYSTDWGSTSPVSPKYGTQLAIDKEGNIIGASANPLKIPHGGYVIVGPKSRLQAFWGVKNVKIKISTTPEWKNVRHIISGGPYLVRDGEVFVDMTAQKLASIGGRNPRSAIGYTSENNLILVAVDGREGSSIGMTLMELANFMKAVGCIGAINLDGGGSTVMYVNGQVVNKPQVKGGIPLSNAIVLSLTDEA